VAHSDWDSPYSPRAVRIHIVRRTGALAAQHRFLGHPWCVSDSDRGIAWGVLATPSIRDLLRVVRGQDVEEEINCPRYLIGATGEGATKLRQDPEDPLPLRQLIFLNRVTAFVRGFSLTMATIPWTSWFLSQVPKMAMT